MSDDLTPEQLADYHASLDEHYRLEHKRGMAALIFAKPPVPTMGDGDKRGEWIEEDATGWRYAWRRYVAWFLLWIGRGYPGDDAPNFKSYDAVDLAVFDYHNDGYGWSCGLVKFHGGQWRAWIETDGECLY